LKIMNGENALQRPLNSLPVVDAEGKPVGVIKREQLVGRLAQVETHALMRMFRPVIQLVLVAGLVAGCASLPDIQPFTDATVSLRSAVASSGAAVVGELQRVEISGVKSNATALEAAWVERNKLFTSLVDYANSLQGIVDAGKTGAESVGALADSVKKLAAAAGIVQPGAGEAAAVVTETAQFVYDQIAKARAAASLEKALAEVQPAIPRIAEEIAADMKDLDVTIRAASKAQKNALEESYQRETEYRDQLLTSRRNLLPKLQQALKDNKSPSALSDAAELAKLDELLVSAEKACEPLNAQLAIINERERLGRQLITEVRSGLADWAATHSRMLTAVRTKRVLSAAELAQAAQRIKALVEKFEKL
jgi:hypothetical protein